MGRALAAACVLALSGCPTVDLGDTPASVELCNPAKGIDYFQSDIMPIYLELMDTVNGCARSSQCHDMADGLALGPTGDPLALTSNYRLVQNYLDCGVPTSSQLLTHPMGLDQHPITIFASVSDPRVVDFLAWFQD